MSRSHTKQLDAVRQACALWLMVSAACVGCGSRPANQAPGNGRTTGLADGADSAGKPIADRYVHTSGNKSPAIIASGNVDISYGADALPAVPRCSELSIDDVLVEKKADSVQLDIRVRNQSPLAVNITRATVKIRDRVPAAGSYKPSAGYDLVIAEAENVVTVAHGLSPNEIDNFLIRLGFTRFNTACFFKAQLVLNYNGGCVAESSLLSFDSNF